MTRWIDISQRLDSKVPTWPGDTQFSYSLTWTKQLSGSVNVGQITMSTHTGTHIDAPFHFDQKGKKVLELDVNLYVGPARVIHLSQIEQGEIGSIGVEAIAQIDLQGVTRLLIRTGAWKDRRIFPDKIPEIRPELAEYLENRGVQLLGLDLPSVDPLDSKELPAHHALARHNIHILEGLVLDDVPAGDYELAALPLPLADADGSPVRAVLRPL
ncbi:arylformamidase [Alicyclobacillus fastidiosus]|uniref:Kynurenine formamidase n=1 Tax=Alicyclobacillus fastidiosus TaxID=392011 RepID=A0ABY6ZHG3_9BACL|nr:arylformamidase [Alicyclobacillus fastidiosus]WAH42048.1 arylformamidase [Alicyclobacillus fastidiosus]GMA63811.1 kynurenine formamidase [Alicyclobacillus fastidiosus]